jgi:hypothetical protein
MAYVSTIVATIATMTSIEAESPSTNRPKSKVRSPTTAHGKAAWTTGAPCAARTCVNR